MKALNAEQAETLDAPHLVHAADADGAYVGLVELEGDLVRVSGPPPSEQWRWLSNTWIFTPTIAQAKAQRWEELKALRQELLQGRFSVGELEYDINPVNITGAAVMAMLALAIEAPFEQVWVLADNSTTTLDAEGMLEVADACAAAVNAVWAISIDLRADLDAIDDETGTLAAVAAVVWPT